MLASEAITRAYREANILPLGATPSTDEMSEGLYRLNALWRSLKSGDIGQELAQWNTPTIQRTASQNADYLNLGFPGMLGGTNGQPRLGKENPQSGPSYNVAFYPPQNSLMLCQITQDGQIISLNQFPDDGAQMGYHDNQSTVSVEINANGRLIEGQVSITKNPGADPCEWFYRADLGEWILQTDLAEDDDLPLPSAFDDLFVTGLAIRLCGLDQVAPQPATQQAFAAILKRARARYRQRMPMTYGGQNTPGSIQNYNYGIYGGSSSDWYG